MGAPVAARHCAFCKKPGGSPFAASVLLHYGGEPGNGYAHADCLNKAKRKAAHRKG